MKLMITVFLTAIMGLWFPQTLYGLKGEVRHLLNRTPVVAVSVKVLETEHRVLTDAQGKFQLSLGPGVYRLRFSKAGFVSITETLVKVPGNKVQVLLFPRRVSNFDAWRIDQQVRAKKDPAEIQTLEFPVIRSSSYYPDYPELPQTINLCLDTVDPKANCPTATYETIDLEEYVKGVLPREIGHNFPLEAMKAQAVAARTYGVKYFQNKGYVCITTICQVWSSTHHAETDLAVEATRGVVMLYNDNLITAAFFASCGGCTEDSEDEWGWDYPYLKTVPCIESAHCTQQCEETIDCSGSPTPKCEENGTTCCFGKFGHRVGLCQEGARAMAECGFRFDEILHHYYSGEIEIANFEGDYDDSEFISKTIPDDQPVNADAPFTASWKIKNTGNTIWQRSNGYRLKRLSGDSLEGPDYLDYEGADYSDPASEKVWTVNLRTPDNPGTYLAKWKMVHNDTPFGTEMTLRIVVSESGPVDAGEVDPGEELIDTFRPDSSPDIAPNDISAETNGPANPETSGELSCECQLNPANKQAPYDLAPGLFFLLSILIILYKTLKCPN